MKIRELRYSNTNTYLIEGERGKLLFDVGWAGTFPLLCRALGEMHLTVQEVDYVLISHFHPDHMGIAQEIADQGATILIPELQMPFLHAADAIFAKEKGTRFVPIRDERVRTFPLSESREILKEIGLDGQIIHTPGHSDDSISLWLDDGALFVGDLNPLYELELHKGTQIGESWEKLLALQPKTVYYGHAKTLVTEGQGGDQRMHETTETAAQKAKEENGQGSASQKAKSAAGLSENEKYALVSQMMKMIDKGYDVKKIQKKTRADEKFIENVMRMYLTHQDVGVQGILDRIELRAMH